MSENNGPGVGKIAGGTCLGLFLFFVVLPIGLIIFTVGGCTILGIAGSTRTQRQSNTQSKQNLNNPTEKPFEMIIKRDEKSQKERAGIIKELHSMNAIEEPIDVSLPEISVPIGSHWVLLADSDKQLAGKVIYETHCTGTNREDKVLFKDSAGNIVLIYQPGELE